MRFVIISNNTFDIFYTSMKSKRSTSSSMKSNVKRTQFFGTFKLFIIVCVISIIVVAFFMSFALGRVTHAATDSVDEIHYSFGNTPDSVMFDWRGQEQNLYYGPDANYGYIAIATNSAITPVDTTGSFQEVQVKGLQPGSTYHYRIGLNGVDHTFQTIPTGDFTWADMGDTTATNCHPWMAEIQSLVAQQNPNFVTHGGDIDYANDCGVAAVHQYYLDQQVWSDSAAFQPVIGNHEYGKPGTEGGMTAPSSTPQDSLLNYKGRSFFTNSQAVPNDTISQTTNPGCGWENGSTTNTCMGEDWGWFQTGNVLFVSYPEPWSNAYPTWQTAADQLMASAQADSNIDFIVTYGHRPAYSSSTTDINTALQAALNNLALKYSPTAGNPNGKYVLNVNHHAHWEEVFKPINGLVHITDGGGGAGQVSPSTIDPNSIFHITHPAILAAHYSASQHSLTVNILCGPVFALNPKATCTYGSVLYTQTFTRNSIVPTSTPIPTPTQVVKQWVGNQSVDINLTGWAGKYGSSPYVTVAQDTTIAHTGAASIRVSALTGASNLSSGFSDSPHWVTSTTAGVTYSQSAWVKPTFVGQVLVMRLREWQGTTLKTDKWTTLTVSSTDWVQLNQTLTAAASGDYLSFIVYAKGIYAGQYFNADDFSLTTSQ